MPEKNLQQQIFHPEKMQLSKFHFYSYGIVAEHKVPSSKIIEVTPVEEMTFLDGFVTGDEKVVTAAGTDSSGTPYETSVKTGATIQAEWLRLSCSNRLTAPDVRRNAPVMIYQFGDSDKYYWTTLKDDSHLRKLETVIWGISATREEGATPSHNNLYYFEISSHRKLVTFHTSQADGEPFGYDFQFNTKEGQVTIKDTAGNYFHLNSAINRLCMKNVDGSLIDITGEVATVETNSEINLKSKKITTTSQELIHKTEKMDTTSQTNKVTSSELTLSANTVVEGPALAIKSKRVKIAS